MPHIRTVAGIGSRYAPGSIDRIITNRHGGSMANPYAAERYLQKCKIALRDLAHAAEVFALEAADNTPKRDEALNRLLEEITKARELLK
jgi:hypothetical protein